MTERCPNCGHASGYWRRSSEDWRCRRCGYVWGGGEVEPEELPAGPVVGADEPAFITQAGMMQAEVERILKERAADLAEGVSEEAEEGSTLLILFSLGDEWYAMDVESVREIRRRCAITPVPGTPDYITGVINLRGDILSVTDLPALLGLSERHEPTAMVVCELSQVTTALLVDQVADIVEVRQGAIEPPLATLERLRAEHVVGQVAIDDRLVTILNLDRVLTPVGS